MPSAEPAPAELALTSSWWAVVSKEWPNQDLIDHLQDFGKREAEMEALQDDLEALPPWLEVRKTTAEHAVAQAKLYADAENTVAALYADEDKLASLDDRQFCAALANRTSLRADWKPEDEPYPVSWDG